MQVTSYLPSWEGVYRPDSVWGIGSERVPPGCSRHCCLKGRLKVGETGEGSTPLILERRIQLSVGLF